MDSPTGDMVILDLAIEGNYVAVRPSGTEPKVKFYMFTYEPPEQLSDLDLASEMMSERLEKIEADLRNVCIGLMRFSGRKSDSMATKRTSIIPGGGPHCTDSWFAGLLACYDDAG